MIARLEARRNEHDDDPIAIELHVNARRRLTNYEIRETVVRVAAMLVDEKQMREVCEQLAQSLTTRPPPPERVK